MGWNLNPGLLSLALDYFHCALCQEESRMRGRGKEGKTLPVYPLYATPPT